MPPKKARAAPARGRGKKTLASPVLPVPSSSASSQSSTPRSPSALSHTRAPPSPSPPAEAPEDAKAASAAPRVSSLRRGVGVAAFFAVFIGVALICVSGSGDAAPRPHPCACATAAAASNPLAKAALSRRSGVSGVHWQRAAGDADRLDASLGCADAVVAPLNGPYATVAELRAAMQAAFQQPRTRCVVWVTSPEAVHRFANALKELLENNALAGTPVVPPHARGTLVMQSSLSREELKNKLPHRVVHMLTTIDQR